MASGQALPGGLVGNYLVRLDKAAFRDVDKLGLSYRERSNLRRQVLKLAYWPTGEAEDGLVVDVDWERQKGVKGGLCLCELRVRGKVQSQLELRVMFWVPSKDGFKTDPDSIFVLHVFPKVTRKITDRVKSLCVARIELLKQRHPMFASN